MFVCEGVAYVYIKLYFHIFNSDFYRAITICQQCLEDENKEKEIGNVPLKPI